MKSRVRDQLLPLAARLSPRPASAGDDTIVILQPDHLGDILLAQPAVRWLRDSNPHSRIVAVVGPWSQEIASLAWPVDEIRTLAYPGFTRDTKSSALDPYRKLRHAATELGPLQPRTAYVLRPDAWWAAWLGSLIADEVVTSGESRCAAFGTTAVPAGDGHATARALRIVAGSGSPPDIDPASYPLSLKSSVDDVNRARRLLDEHAAVGRFAVIHPGSGAAVKEWPVDRWGVVARALHDEGLNVVLTGTASEADLCESIAARVEGAVSLAGRTPVAVLAALLRQASVVLGPDCGPLHLAVAAGAPTIHLFGPSDPTRYGPWGDAARHRVIRAGWSCPRCGDLSASRPSGCGCMLAISANAVIDAARELVMTHAV